MECSRPIRMRHALRAGCLRLAPHSRPSLLTAAACLLVLGAAHGDLIDDTVAKVSQDRLRDHIAALEFPRADAEAQAIAAAYIADQLDGFGYTVLLGPVQESNNVIARLEGAVTPERVFIIGAHLDTVADSPGADDNASGIAGMLEVARLLASVELESSVEFVAFTLEEVGLLGSTEFAEQAGMMDEDIIGMVALDMIGYTCATPGCQEPIASVPECLRMDPESVTTGTAAMVLGNDASEDLLLSFTGAAQDYVPGLELTLSLVAGIGECYSDTRRSDHSPFWDTGYRALVITETFDPRNPNYHTEGDMLETLDLPFARRITQAALATVLLEAGLIGSVGGGGEGEGAQGIGCAEAGYLGPGLSANAGVELLILSLGLAGLGRSRTKGRLDLPSRAA